MAQRVAFHYLPGESLLHRWDGRCKFLSLLVTTATLLQIKVAWLALNSVGLVVLFTIARLPTRRLWRDVRGWTVLLGLLLLFHSLFTPGRRIDIFPWVPLSQEGLYVGALMCWRLSIILAYGLLFTAVTRPREVRESLMWLLKPLPLVPGPRIGLMVSLALHFFSLVLDQAEEIRLAYVARLGDEIKNPLRKFKTRVFPIVRRSFLHVEEVTFALAARGYREDVQPELPNPTLNDWIPFVLLVLLLVLGSEFF